MRKPTALGFGLLLVCGTVQAQYVISTAAGDWRTLLPASATSVAFPTPTAVVADASGNVYFTTWNFVLKVDSSGVLTRVAGILTRGFSGDGGPATSAQLDNPESLALDGAGNLYIADWGNNRVRRVAANGAITTVAGNGTLGYSGDGGPATSALLEPTAVAADAAGNLYIADKDDSVVRKVSVNGIISTVAGTGVAGYSGDAGQATSAQFHYPLGIAVDGSGNFYVADTGNNAIRKVAANGIVTTVAGTGVEGYSGDGGQARNAQLDQPVGLKLDAAGNLYIADTVNARVRKVATSGVITTVAGNGTADYSGDGGAATSASLYSPVDVAADSSGNLYIADYDSNRIRKVTASGIVTTLAGNGNASYSGDGGLATRAQLGQPNGVAVDGSGNLYIVDTTNNAIRKVVNGVITRVAGDAAGTPGCLGDGGPATSAQLMNPQGAAFDAAGNLYIADWGCSEVRKVATNGAITTVAGTGTAGDSGDGGQATSAQLDWPWSVAVDSAGNLYIADYSRNRVRKVATNGIITAVAGNGTAGYSGDGGPATAATLDAPSGLAVDTAGNLYIADAWNAVVRKVTPSGTISTVAGDHTEGYSGDGGLATAARLDLPSGVALDASGNLYIADSWNDAIRRVDSNGAIATVAGNHTEGYSGDGGPATSAELDTPSGVAVGVAGQVYIADTTNNAVRLLAPAATSPLLSVTKTHAGSFTTGETEATYTVVVSNAAGAAATSGTVTVTETTPSGLALVSMSGSGWSCSTNTCARGSVLSPGSSYPAITVTVNVTASASAQVVNQVSVSGGGSAPAGASDPTTIAGPPPAPVLSSPANGSTGVPASAGLSWQASAGAASYDVYFGTLSTPPLAGNTTSTSYSPGGLTAGATYYWRIVARNGSGSAASATWSFTAGAAVMGLRFSPVTPCRLVDTRNPAGPFGGPAIAGGTARSFAIPQSGCGIPATAQAYSLNVTVVPRGRLSYLTLWPAEQAKPLVSTLNSWGGIVTANAAIVPAGAGGAVSVYVTDTTDIILDINGYFDAFAGPSAYVFYPVSPCRIADTRNPAGTFGGPSMSGNEAREFPIPSSACGIPNYASAYALNVTAVPDAIEHYLGYLTAFPAGSPRPNVSTLNSWTGKVVANAALVPSGTNQSISVFASNATDVILDINGYFGLSGGQGALAFVPVAPCRVADTRSDTGPFGGPVMEARTTRSFAIPASGCNVPSNAAVYSVNVTVAPDGPLSYLTAWPAGVTQPGVSTLNSWDGAVVANAAIVPAGTGGAISIYVTNRTHVILDINGYFAP
jgi:uncharacterized repeat protein (TIGR01451 family)